MNLQNPHHLIRSSIKDFITDDCFIYFLYKKESLVYVGQTTNYPLFRILHHNRDKDFDSYAFIKCPQYELDNLESAYIVEYTPLYNFSVPCCPSGWIGCRDMKSKFKDRAYRFKSGVSILTLIQDFYKHPYLKHCPSYKTIGSKKQFVYIKKTDLSEKRGLVYSMIKKMVDVWVNIDAHSDVVRMIIFKTDYLPILNQ